MGSGNEIGVTDADVVRACPIGNRAVASRGSSRLSPRRKSKEPVSQGTDSVERFRNITIRFAKTRIINYTNCR